MPQDTKAMPVDPDSDVALGVVHENLEGYIPFMASDEEICVALEKAFDYRGDITLTRKDGSIVEGYLFDRSSTGRKLADFYVRLYRKNTDEKIKIAYSDVARLEFSGKDTAAGKSFETWVKKYNEKKNAGEKNIGIEPEKLD